MRGQIKSKRMIISPDKCGMNSLTVSLPPNVEDVVTSEVKGTTAISHSYLRTWCLQHVLLLSLEQGRHRQLYEG